VLAAEPTLVFVIRENCPLTCSRDHRLIPQVTCYYAFFLFNKGWLDYLIHPLRVHDALQLQTCPELFPLFVRVYRLLCRFLSSEKRKDVDLWWFGSNFFIFNVFLQLALWKRLDINRIRVILCVYPYPEPLDYFVCDSLISTKMDCLQSGRSSQILTDGLDNLSRHSCRL